MAKKNPQPTGMSRADIAAAKKSQETDLVEVANKFYWQGFWVGLLIGAAAAGALALGMYGFSLR